MAWMSKEAYVACAVPFRRSSDKIEKTKNHARQPDGKRAGGCFADVTWAARVDIKRPRVSARVLAFRLCNATLSALATRSIACTHDTLNNFLSPVLGTSSLSSAFPITCATSKIEGGLGRFS